MASLGHRPYFCALLLLILQQTTIKYTSSQQLPPEESAYYYVGCFTERTDLLKESVYAKMPQTCVEICEHQSYRFAVLSSQRCFCSNNANSEERQDMHLCNTRCSANKAQYCGGVGVHSYYATMLVKQSAPNNLKVLNSTEHSLTIEWEAYETRRLYIAGAAATSSEKITNFLIKTYVVETYSSLPLFAQPEFLVQSTETHFEFTDLQPATVYNISVKALCAQNICGSASLVGTTEVDVPSPEPLQPKILSRTDATITIEIAPIKNDNGPVSKVLIIVERVDNALSQAFDTELLNTWQKAQDDGLPYYIAAELDYDRPEDNRKRQFVVGDGKRYGRYRNAALEKQPDESEAHVHISLGVVSSLNGVTKTLYTRSSHAQHASPMDDFTYATFDKGQQSVVALAVTCVIFGTCLLLSLIAYIYLRYKTCKNRSGQRNTHEMTLQQPIIERENNGFVVEDELPPTMENFKQQLEALIDGLDNTKRLPRNVLRMNVNDVIAEGRYGEVITAKLISNTMMADNAECQIHVVALDELTTNDQAHFLRDLRYLTRLQRHEHLLDFYGISASADWFYIVGELQTVSLKRRLIESRRAPNSAPVQRLTALSEELVLQWIYEISSAMIYLHNCKIVHRQLCSHNIYITADTKVKLGYFGPIPFMNNLKKVDISRWLAPEALRYQHFTTKSDVWAFACVAWECASLGATPYANIKSSQHLLDAIKSGSRPAQPSFVYQDLYQLLLNCWQAEPSERISFEDIAFNVRQLMTSPRHVLCFDRLSETFIAGNNIVDTLPFYLPMLEVLN